MTIYYPYPDLHGAAGSGIDDKLLIRLLPFHRGSIFFLQDKLFPQSFWNQSGGVLLSEGRTASVVPKVRPNQKIQTKWYINCSGLSRYFTSTNNNQIMCEKEDDVISNFTTLEYLGHSDSSGTMY